MCTKRPPPPERRNTGALRRRPPIECTVLWAIPPTLRKQILRSGVEAWAPCCAEAWSFSKEVPAVAAQYGDAHVLFDLLLNGPLDAAIDDVRFYDLGLAPSSIAHLHSGADPSLLRAKVRPVRARACAACASMHRSMGVAHGWLTC